MTLKVIHLFKLFQMASFRFVAVEKSSTEHARAIPSAVAELVVCMHMETENQGHRSRSQVDVSASRVSTVAFYE